MDTYIDKLTQDFQCRFKVSKNLDWDDIIEQEVKKVFANISKAKDSYTDCILKDYISKHKKSIEFCHKLKIIQMKLGIVWQNLMGYVDGIENLGVGHCSGLDLMSSSRKLIMELKNSTNTDNSSSRKHNLFKLKEFIRDYADYTAIYGFINDKTIDGRDEIKDEDGCKVRYLSGNKLLKFVFGEEYKYIREKLKQKISQILE